MIVPLGFSISPNIATAQYPYGQIGSNPAPSIVCDLNNTSPDADKILSWSGTWEWSARYDVVGCYAPVYGSYSPPTFYSPGAPINAPAPDREPGSSTGNESVSLPQTDPWEPGDGQLLGAFVWFKYGNWLPFNGKYYWFCVYPVCDWYWVANPGGGCFSTGTHLLTPEGSKSIEQFVVGDEILSSPRENRAATPTPRRIERIMERRAKLLEIVVGGQVINTTAGHPFFTKDRGWIPAISLTVGDSLRTHNNRWVQVEAMKNGVESTVYNVVVDGDSAYFVGQKDWQFSILASDACNNLSPPPQLVATIGRAD